MALFRRWLAAGVAPRTAPGRAAPALGWSVAALVTRIVLGAVLFRHGWSECHPRWLFIDFLGALDVPWPHVASSLIAGTQMVCGGLLLVGLLGRAAAAVMLAGFTAAVLYAADVHGLGDLLALDQTARIALCCWLVAAGSGEWSIDAWAARYRSRRV